MIYLDNAATSWPKPDCVPEAMLHFLREVGASPGRSGHRLALEAERVRLDAREAVAALFGAPDPMRVVFTLNATTALNIVARGLLSPGAHVLTTGIEHNAVLRPLRALEQCGVVVDVVPCARDGTVEVAAVEDNIGPRTQLLVVNHASNVCGTVLPIRAIGEVARRHGVAFAVDAAQTGGCWPIDVEADHVDLLAFSGHKGLLGPTGTGGLVLGRGFNAERLPALVHGGTGSRSEDEHQPDFLPDKYEAGTPNIVGLAGLLAAMRYVSARGVEAIRAEEQALTQRLIDGLMGIPGVRVVGTGKAQLQTAVVSFTLDGHSVSQIALALDEQFGVLCRPGLHCAPRAHQTLGTAPQGTLRLSPGPFTTTDEIDRVVEAVRQLAGRRTDG